MLVVYSEIGIVIGVLKSAEKTLIIGNPRQIAMPKAGEDIMRYRVIELFGQPKEIEFSEGEINHDVHDIKLIKAYEESVTGLVVLHPGDVVPGL